MTETKFADLIQRALRNDNPALFDKSEAAIYKEFELAEARHRKAGGAGAGDNLHFKFEKVRLGVAIALMQVFSEMADYEESRQVLKILKEASQATSIAQIDATISKNMKAFDNLYRDLFINDEGEILLQLFERTLHADSKADMDQIIHEGLIFLDQVQED